MQVAAQARILPAVAKMSNKFDEDLKTIPEVKSGTGTQTSLLNIHV